MSDLNNVRDYLKSLCKQRQLTSNKTLTRGHKWREQVEEVEKTIEDLKKKLEKIKVITIKHEKELKNIKKVCDQGFEIAVRAGSCFNPTDAQFLKEKCLAEGIKFVEGKGKGKGRRPDVVITVYLRLRLRYIVEIEIEIYCRD